MFKKEALIPRLIVSTCIFCRPVNTNEFLPDAIECIYEDIKDVKFVVSCQGKESKKWLENYDHPALIKIFHPENIGKEAHNQVAENYDCELFLELDDDAKLPKHIMKYCLHAFNFLPDDTGFLGVGCDAKPYKFMEHNKHKFRIIKILDHDLHVENVSGTTSVLGIFRMCRLKVWKHVGGHPKKSFYATDAYIGWMQRQLGYKNAFFENINSYFIAHKQVDSSNYRKFKNKELKKSHKRWYDDGQRNLCNV